MPNNPPAFPTAKQRRSWSRRVETIRKSAHNMMCEMMVFEGPPIATNKMRLSDWADNIAHQAEELQAMLTEHRGGDDDA